MLRILTTSCVLGLLLVAGCDPSPEGSIVIETDGTLQLAHEIRWEQGSHDWDVRVDCLMSGYIGHETLLISAYDNTFEDGLFIDLQIQEFDGNGTYVRTENQPLEALSIDLTDAQTDSWNVGTADGGSCEFTVESGGREGTYTCSDVPGVVQGTSLAFDDLQVGGNWTCTGLYRDSGNVVDETERW